MEIIVTSYMVLEDLEHIWGVKCLQYLKYPVTGSF